MTDQERIALKTCECVRVRDDHGTEADYIVKNDPWQLPNGTWLIGLKGISGGYLLDRVVSKLDAIDSPPMPATSPVLTTVSATQPSRTWPTPIDNVPNQLHRPITEDWLRAHGFRIIDNRNDDRLPVRRLPCRWDGVDGRQMFSASDDLCIDVSPVNPKKQDEWFVWIHQDEPYRSIHVRQMKYTWEVARLYEGLTGRVWPGTL